MKTTSIRNILVPIDFSEMSISAIHTAKQLAQKFGASIHLAHVRQPSYPTALIAPVPPMVPFSVVTYAQETEEKTDRRLRLLAIQHGLSPTTCHVIYGAPVFQKICLLAKELPADLIVLPTHGHTALKHVFLGSTAERVVQHAPCPVFIAREHSRHLRKDRAVSIDTILVPVDFSGCSLAGLNYAIAFAEKAAAKIVVLHVVYLDYAYAANGYAMYDLTVLRKDAEKDAERQMREFLRAAKFGRVPFETVIRIGHPVEEISALAREAKVDLIITSTHGRTGFDHVLIGSTAEHVVRHATCPVLVTPSHPAMRTAQLTAPSKRARRARPTKIRSGIDSNGTFTRKDRKLRVNAFPERRKTNKFRESHTLK